MKPSYATSPGTSPANVFSEEDVDLLLEMLMLDNAIPSITDMSTVGHQESQGTESEFERIALEDFLSQPVTNYFRVGDDDDGAQTSLSPDGEVETFSKDEQLEGSNNDWMLFDEDVLLGNTDVERESEDIASSRPVRELVQLAPDTNAIPSIPDMSTVGHLGSDDELEQIQEESQSRGVAVVHVRSDEVTVVHVRSDKVASNCSCSKLVSFCRGSPLSAMSPFECIHLFRCLITNDEFQAWTRRLNDLVTLRSNVRKRINNDISELDFYKCYLGIYDDPKANHRYSMEKPQKERKHAGKAIVFYVLSKFVEDPLSLDDQRRLFDGITTLKDLVSNRDEMGALFDVFRSLRAVGMLLSPAGNQKVFMVIASMVLGDGVFHQRGGRHMTKKAKCLEAIVVALIKMFPAERCRKRRRDVDDGSSRSELAEVASAEESAAEPSSKRRRAY